MPSFGYSITFKNGTTNSGIHVKAESERDLIKSLVDDHFTKNQIIVSIIVIEMNRGDE